MNFDEMLRELRRLGGAISDEQATQFRSTYRGECVHIGAPHQPKKARIIEYGTTVSSAFVARELGVTVQHVRRVRRLLRG